jgi:hypothetical protein
LGFTSAVLSSDAAYVGSLGLAGPTVVRWLVSYFNTPLQTFAEDGFVHLKGLLHHFNANGIKDLQSFKLEMDHLLPISGPDSIVIGSKGLQHQIMVKVYEKLRKDVFFSIPQYARAHFESSASPYVHSSISAITPVHTKNKFTHQELAYTVGSFLGVIKMPISEQKTCYLCKMDIFREYGIQHVHNCKKTYGNTSRHTGVQRVLEGGLSEMKDVFAVRHEPPMREFYQSISDTERLMQKGHSGDILLTSQVSGERTLIDTTVIQLPYDVSLNSAVEDAEKIKFSTYCDNYDIEKDRVLPMVFFYNGYASIKSDDAIRSWCLMKSNVNRSDKSLRLRSNQDVYLRLLNGFRVRLSMRLAKHGASQYHKYTNALPTSVRGLG